MKWHLHNSYLIASLDISLILTCEVFGAVPQIGKKYLLSSTWTSTHILLTPPLQHKSLNSTFPQDTWPHAAHTNSSWSCCSFRNQILYTRALDGVCSSPSPFLKGINPNPLHLPMLGSIFYSMVKDLSKFGKIVFWILFACIPAQATNELFIWNGRVRHMATRNLTRKLLV